jgi:type IV secretory pathway VirJ component
MKMPKFGSNSIARRQHPRAIHHFSESKNGVKMALNHNVRAQPCFQGNKTRSSALLGATLVVTAALASPACAQTVAKTVPATVASPTPTSQNASNLSFGPFGQLAIYKTSPEPKNFVIFISGDGGWNLGVVDMARELASMDATVVGVDITHYLRAAQTAPGSSFYAAADFQNLAQYVQRRLGFQTYKPPIIVGYSSGATLAYGIMGQSPGGIFRAGLGLGFCPDLKTDKPLSHGSGLTYTADPTLGFIYAPQRLATPFVALQGMQDQVCLPQATIDFSKRAEGMGVIQLPKVGHGYSVPANWMPQMRSAFGSLAGANTVVAARVPQASATPAANSVADLPLTIIPATVAGKSQSFAIMLSGDGGWSSIDGAVASGLAARGVPTVGWSSLTYFWNKKTPDQAASDLARTIEHYAATWKRQKVALVGYSFGADPLPFMVNRLPAQTRAKVSSITLMGPSGQAEFQFQPGDWLNLSRNYLPTQPEIARLGSIPVLCVYGQDETDSLCPLIPKAHATPLVLPGGHHFGGRFDEIAAAVAARLS